MTNEYYNYLGYGVTDSNGIAKLDHDASGNPINHSYTGVGAGEIDVVASLDNPIASGSIVSEPCNVLDCTYYDDGFGNNPNYYSNTNNVSQTVVTDGRKLESTNSTTANYLLNIGDTPSSLASTRDFIFPFCIEMDIVDFDTNEHQIGFNSATSNLGRKFSQLGISSAPFHLKVKFEEMNGVRYANYYLDNNTTPTYQKGVDNEMNYAIVFQCLASHYFTFKNVKVYPI